MFCISTVVCSVLACEAVDAICDLCSASNTTQSQAKTIKKIERKPLCRKRQALSERESNLRRAARWRWSRSQGGNVTGGSAVQHMAKRWDGRHIWHRGLCRCTTHHAQGARHARGVAGSDCAIVIEHHFVHTHARANHRSVLRLNQW